MVHFCPPGSGYRSRDLLISNPIPNPDTNHPDPQHWFADYKLRDLTFKCVKDSSKVIITVFVNLLFRILLPVFKLRIADPDPDFADQIHHFFNLDANSGLGFSVTQKVELLRYVSSIFFLSSVSEMDR